MLNEITKEQLTVPMLFRALDELLSENEAKQPTSLSLNEMTNVKLANGASSVVPASAVSEEMTAVGKPWGELVIGLKNPDDQDAIEVTDILYSSYEGPFLHAVAGAVSHIFTTASEGESVALVEDLSPLPLDEGVLVSFLAQFRDEKDYYGDLNFIVEEVFDDHISRVSVNFMRDGEKVEVNVFTDAAQELFLLLESASPMSIHAKAMTRLCNNGLTAITFSSLSSRVLNNIYRALEEEYLVVNPSILISMDEVLDKTPLTHYITFDAELDGDNELEIKSDAFTLLYDPLYENSKRLVMWLRVLTGTQRSKT